jgi:valyl-tRNA synthetase
MADTLSSKYDPKQHEAAIYSLWEKEGVFGLTVNPKEDRTPFVVMLPPPNITGSLHMGHALQDTIMDILVRWHRMQGDPTVWVPGTDHAALPTNRILEKQLKEEGTTKETIGREAFLRKADEWYAKVGDTIVGQMKRLGASCDWDRAVFTMDPSYIQAVQEAFVRYHQRGLIYRGDRIVNWCLHCASVISDLEIKHQKRTDKLFYIRYALADDATQSVVVATTRPETMLGDTAVAVHPDDARYKDLIGKELKMPLTGRLIPIVGDTAIDPAFGTGAVKVTPAHDATDAEIGQRHNLPILNVINEQGIITDAAPEIYRGLTLVQARAKVLEDLQAAGFLEKEEPIEHTVNVCERCGTVIEPLISRQWFVRMDSLAKQALAAAQDDLVTFYPPRWKEHFTTWLESVHDWTISRQIWLGQQIPVWWKPGTRGTNNEEGNFVVSKEKPEGEWEQDPDVLDTWFSSALWPFATLGWPEATADLARLYPTSVLVTARDILYLWVARMVFSGLELLQDEQYGRPTPAERVPFKQVFIHPTVLTKSGQRMSKSLGTGVDPLELIEQYGADATRFGLMYQMNFDRQAIRYDEAAIESARNFANKIWNIARLLQQLPDREEESVADAWITSRLQSVITEITDDLAAYRIGEAARTLYTCVWKEYADWYVEIVKTEGSTKVVRQTFLQLLQLLHPFMPHVTEVLWASFGQEGLIARAAWPQAHAVEVSEATNDVTRFQTAVTTVRSVRKLLGIAPAAVVEVALDTAMPLPASFQALAKAQLLENVTQSALRFPLGGGEFITIASAEITSDSIAATKKKLEAQKEKIEMLIASQVKVLEQMKKKAPQERIVIKEGEISALKQQITDIENNLALLA